MSKFKSSPSNITGNLNVAKYLNVATAMNLGPFEIFDASSSNITGQALKTGGITWIRTGNHSADSTYTLADGVVNGQFKRIRLGTDGGDDAEITVASANFGGTPGAADAITLTAVGDTLDLVWYSTGGFWVSAFQTSGVTTS